ncbi:hypothetical protein NDU88_004356 [Pleurodeles waltl]|uniref:Uncharacterized protein n=1 Tax=Pleurodeles waltl TaxID=8319 RepID=A0AAV7WRM0_PLEWA|nr:hypothetical protein NDU88_004356 [Pleurodeles waltl]
MELDGDACARGPACKVCVGAASGEILAQSRMDLNSCVAGPVCGSPKYSSWVVAQESRTHNRTMFKGVTMKRPKVHKARTTRLQKLEQEVVRLQERVENTDSRSCNKNIHLVGVPERAEGPNMDLSLAEWLASVVLGDRGRLLSVLVWKVLTTA